MVETPNWVGAPVTGCNHGLAARAASAASSSPCAGGADNKGPTTENRRCAHRSWTGGLGDSFIGAPFVRDALARSERTLGGGERERSRHLVRVRDARPPSLT